MSAATGSAGPLFVMGTGRSGTTLLRALLNAHPEVHLTFEGSYFSFPRPPLRSGDVGGERWLARYRRGLPYRWLRLPPEAVERGLGRPTSASEPSEVMAALMQAAAARHGRPRWGDKTPTHLLHLPELFAAFPTARVLHLVRDPRAVVASLARMPWAPPGALLNALYVRAQLALVPRPHPAILELRLEDLLAHPERELQRALAFAGLPWSPRLLDHGRHAPTDSPPFPWLLSAHRALRPARTGQPWALSAADLRLTEAICAPALARYGYAAGAHPAATLDERFRALALGLRPLPRTLRQLLRIRRLLRGDAAPELETIVDLFMATNGRFRLAPDDRERVLSWLETEPPSG